jgi:hypothetical protein
MVIDQNAKSIDRSDCNSLLMTMFALCAIGKSVADLAAMVGVGVSQRTVKRGGLRSRGPHPNHDHTAHKGPAGLKVGAALQQPGHSGHP